MAEPLFPRVERVIYQKAPLVEVVCQVRFPTDLSIETQAPVDFQKRIRGLFPILTTKKQAFLSTVPPEVAKAFEAVMPPGANKTIWQFKTEDDTHALELLKDNLTLMSHAYRRWEEFFHLFNESLRTLIELYNPPFFTRVGLRYRNMIQRSKLGLKDARWSSILKPYILGELGEPGIDETQASEVARTLVLQLPEKGASVRLQHGFAMLEGCDEKSYLIDCDFFVERTEVTNVEDVLGYFHNNAASYFRWCIEKPLHDALEPRSIAS